MRGRVKDRSGILLGLGPNYPRVKDVLLCKAASAEKNTHPVPKDRADSPTPAHIYTASKILRRTVGQGVRPNHQQCAPQYALPVTNRQTAWVVGGPVFLC